MSVTITPNMSLPIPGVGDEPGPDYATDVNNALTIVDAHSHVNGSGVPITPSAININSALTLNNNSLISIAALTLQPQLSDAAANSVYEKGVDLYYRDGSGNVIRITQSGSVAGSTGTITGLPSGTASAAFAAGTFIFQASTNTGANIDGASFIFRNSTASSKGLTLQPPNAMAADYSLTLPALPPAQQIMTLDNAGNITAPYTVDGSTIEVSSNVIQVKDAGITSAKLASDLNLPGTHVTIDSLSVPVFGQPSISYNLRMIRGQVNAAGSILLGEGFSVSKTSSGHYTLTYSLPSPPVILVSAEYNNSSFNAIANFVADQNTTTTHIITSVANNPNDAGFSFLLIG